MAVKTYTYEELQAHQTPTSCWVVLYGHVYDITSFLPSHPGGSGAILRLAGTDATEDYDPIHPPGTLEANLSPEAKLGPFDATTLPKPTSTPQSQSQPSPPLASAPPITTLSDCLNLSDIETLALSTLSPKARGYYFSASDDLHSKTLNSLAYRSILLRPRIFVDCTRCSLSTSLLTTCVSPPLSPPPPPLPVPFFVSPAAMARLAHTSGEKGIADACAAFGAMQIISNNASQTPEQIVAGAGEGRVFGWQLYVQEDRGRSEGMLARIGRLEAIRFVCLTLDAAVPGKREDDERASGVGAKLAVTSGVRGGDEGRDAEGKGGDGSGGVGRGLFAGTAADLTWGETLGWLGRHTALPVVLKGVQTHEDAYIASCMAPRVRGIILSNHGGRALDTAPPAIHTLLEIRKFCPEVFERIDVWVDGGIKRGTDVVKALALGAKAVGIGRAPLYGLGAGGPKGVEKVLEILRAETDTAMRLLGVENVAELGPQHVNTRMIERDLFDGASGLRDLGRLMSSKL